MSKYTVGERLRTLRKEKGWSQVKLGRQSHVSQTRISKLETGVCYPSPDEWARLLDSLGGRPTPLPHRQSLPYPDRSWRVSRPAHYCTGDVPLSSRFYRAKKSFGELARARIRDVEHREDSAQVYDFLNQACLDSGHEAMFWLHVLHAGGQPCWYAPLRAGFRRFRVVDRGPDRKTISDVRLPCLQIKRGLVGLLLYPQVSLDARRTYYRLDVLACVSDGSQRVWANIEIDGSGHDGEFDLEREDDLSLPTIRILSKDLASNAMFDNLVQRLQPLLLTEGTR